MVIKTGKCISDKALFTIEIPWVMYYVCFHHPLPLLLYTVQSAGETLCLLLV